MAAASAISKINHTTGATKIQNTNGMKILALPN